MMTVAPCPNCLFFLSRQFPYNPYLTFCDSGLHWLYVYLQSVYTEDHCTWRTQHLLCSVLHYIILLKIHIWHLMTVLQRVFGRDWTKLKDSFHVKTAHLLFLLFHSRYFPENPYLALCDSGLQMLYVWKWSVCNEGLFTWRTQHLLCSICYSIQCIL